MAHSKVNRKKNNEFSLGWWFLTILISFIISAAIIYIIHVIWHPSISSITTGINTGINTLKGEPGSPGLPSINNKEIILAMGVDSNGRNSDPFESTRSDVMMLVALDPSKNTINAISIPRDSKVYIANGHSIDKINAAHAYGGPELAVKTVEQTLGVHIDHYVVIDYAGLKELVRALGGVNVYVEKRMKYTDNTARLFIDLQPGEQLLDADKAEMYLRFRKDAEADIGRIKRQQWFMKGVLEKLKEPATILKIPELIQLSKKYVRTDMSITQMMRLAGFAKGVNFEKIQVATLPGKPNMNPRISYWLIDVNQAQALIDRLIYGYEDSGFGEDLQQNPITLSIMYNSDKKEDLTALLTELEETQYKVVCKTSTKEPHTKIISHTGRATLDRTNDIRTSLTEFRKAPVFLAPNDIYCAASDYTIVLGKD